MPQTLGISWPDPPAKWRGNLADRRGDVAVGTFLAAGLPWLGGASPWLIVVSSVVVLAWGAAWPRPSPTREALDAADAEPLDETANHWSRTATFWRSVLSGIDGPALALDRSTRVLAVNGAAEPLLSAPEGSYVSIAIRSPTLDAALERALATGIQQNFVLNTTVPVERRLDGMATPLTLPDRGSARARGEGPALLVVLRDRTEQQQLASMRADFVANASHELRTPLASIRGFVETLRGAAKDDAEARERFLGIMQAQTERMSRLIDDLLSLSRIEMRAHVPPTGRVEMAGVVGEAVAALRGLADQRGIVIAVAEPTTAAQVIGDRDELIQVAQNLLQNAIKYGRQGGRVDVSLARDGNWLMFAVADDGIGIAPEHLPRLTERFYRVSAKDSRERGGTGLGLAIVKHIINRHRGDLSVASAPGVGSTFTVRLPSAA